MNASPRSIHWLAGLIVAALTASMHPPGLYGQANPTIESAEKSWKDRENRVRSATFSWNVRCTIAKGYISKMMSGAGAARLKLMGVRPGEIIPPDDYSYDIPSSFSLSGDNVRYVEIDRRWSASDHVFVTSRYESVFNGTVAKTYYPQGTPPATWPIGFVHKEDAHADARSISLRPCLLAFRASESKLRPFDVREFQSLGGKAVIDGKPCVELRRQNGNYAERFWVDPARDYVVVRCLETVNESLVGKMTIQYRADQGAGWVPTKWEHQSLSPDGRVLVSTNAVVSHYEINAHVPASDFEITFAPGTRVSDMKEKTEYVVKEGGGQRIIEKSEIGATYAQVVNSERGEALGKKERGLPGWGVIVTGALGVVAVFALLWRRGRRYLPPGRPGGSPN